MQKFLITALLCLAPTALLAQAANAPQAIEFEGKTWRITAQDAHVEKHLGRDALFLKGGRLWRDDIDFGDGVIEFDVTFDEVQGFIGPMWRASSDNRFEEIYFRSHLSGKPDAVQYTPVEHGLSAWQIFSDQNAIAPIDLKPGEWNRLKVVVQGDAADFYFNSNEPLMHIPDLKTDIVSGHAGLRSTSPAGGAALFSNITFRPLRDGEGVVGKPKETPPLPDGLISTWNVSSTFSEEMVANNLSLTAGDHDNLDWRKLDAETNGIANLARLADSVDGADTAFVRLSIKSDRAQMKELLFGYSDRVRVYLNGKRVYYGDAGWRTRDYRFLGTVGFFDSVGLDLKRGENELLVAVSETFGGWAWAGAMADQSGVTLSQ